MNKMTKNYGAFLLMLLALGFFTKCVSDKELSSAVVPSFENFDVAYETFDVSPEGGSFTLVNGTELVLPANCFVDADGNLIEGNVQLKYREFHQPEDVIASGIPMTYQEGGEEGFLVTAGMMELRGTDANGNEVFFAPNKTADFNMASFLDEEGVDFYALDETTGTWTKTGSQQPHPKPEGKDTLGSEIERLSKIKAPFAPKKRNTDEPVVQFSSGTGFDEIEGLETVLWRYAGTEESNNPFAYKAFNDDNYTVTRSEIIDPELNTMEVEMTFRYKKGDTIQTQPKSLVTWFAPVLSNSKFKEASAIYADKEAYYKAQMEKRMALIALQEQEALLTRSFSVSKFGYYNCDIFSRAPYMEGEILFTQNGTATEKPFKVYLVNERGGVKSTVGQSYDPRINKRIKLLVEGNNNLVVILDGDHMATVSQQQLQEGGFGDGVCSIDIDNAQKVASVEEVKELIANI